MKKLIGITALLALALAAAAAFGQAKTEKKIVKRVTVGEAAPCEKGPCGLKLTEEQRKKIDALETETEKALLSVRAQIGVKDAELKQLMLADKADQAAVEKKVEEIGALRTEMEKKRVLQRIAVRGLLTPEQRVDFDRQELRRGHGPGFGPMGPEGPGFPEPPAGERHPGRMFMRRHMSGVPDAPPAPPAAPSEEEIEIETR
jgi:Spy/CpxP family protein refolding chaperone